MRHGNWLAAGSLVILSTTAAAQGSVNVWGIVDLGVNTVSSGATRVTRMAEGGKAASRLGFRGSENLGGGLRVDFLLEAGIDPATGAGTLPGPQFAFTRQSFLSIASPWGELMAGRMYTPEFDALLRADPLLVNARFSSLNLLAATDAQPGVRTFAARASNMLRYRTPASQPLLLDVGYALGSAARPHDRDGNFYGAAVGWKQEPFYLAYSIQSVVTDSATAPVTTPYRTRYQALSASWRMLPELRLTGNYALVDACRAGVGQARVMDFGIEWNVTPASRLVVTAASRRVHGSARAQHTWTLGYDYALSKRTMLYARLLGLSNAGHASVSMDNVPVATDSGDGVHSLALGIFYRF